MRPGDRIELLRKLASRLAEDDYPWDEIDLVLRQFGFPTTDRWDGDRRSYALEMLERGRDENLVELDEYLFGGSSRDNLELTDLPWEAGAFRLFVSHTSPNTAIAGELRTIFARWRIDAFVAHDTIEPTREWQREIESALNTCHALTALMTEDFVTSKWCDQEVGFCIARKIPIVPVRLGADPHGFIGKYQAASPASPGTAPWIADVIFRALSRHAAVRETMAMPIVHRYATSTNEDGARINLGLLQEVNPESWTRELVDVAERAASENRFVAQALAGDWTVAESAAALLRPIRDRLRLSAPAMATDDDIPF